MGDRITRTPGVCGGKACIAGHRVRVLDIVSWYEHQGLSPDDIVSEIPSVSLADVHTALAYYYDHLDEIRDEMESEWALAESCRQSNPSLLNAKLAQGRLKEAS